MDAEDPRQDVGAEDRPGTGPGSARGRIHQVTELTPHTLTQVAERVAAATGFEDLVYRESEIDALWSLVDIRTHQAERAASPDLEKWTDLRTRLWEAHDLVPEGQCARAAAILRELAALL